MGKGDRKTRRGKIWRGSYGNSRPRKIKKVASQPVKAEEEANKAEEKEEVSEENKKVEETAPQPVETEDKADKAEEKKVEEEKVVEELQEKDK